MSGVLHALFMVPPRCHARPLMIKVTNDYSEFSPRRLDKRAFDRYS